ncbi:MULTISPECIES: LPXTG cell wall anchor domain-containing protein [unclassified Streptomyces]|uniref:LPXTG cell wall anchor domain-containing protein n=1 Tax=unclassified Streptomyces TaxID=2593676 RepID=UPI00382EDA02
MSSARRPLLTAAAAGTLLGALWFVPNANASQDHPARHQPARTAGTAQATTQARALAAQTVTRTTSGTDTAADTDAGLSKDATDAKDTAGAADTDGLADASGADTTDASDAADASDGGVRLADTGSFDTTPYVAGGTTLLALGAGFVAYSVRRERLGL